MPRLDRPMRFGGLLQGEGLLDLDAQTAALETGTDPRRLLIGGKSMGGRMASLIAGDRKPAGLVCLGYPFHPPGKPERLRIEHLTTLNTPTLICQGTRDPFGNREEVGGYPLSQAIRLAWIDDGEHSFKPRKRSGRTREQNLVQAVAAIVEFSAALESFAQHARQYPTAPL